MKDKNIFDILENAENGSMNRLADKCPEISDEQLDRIFVKSEKKLLSLSKMVLERACFISAPSSNSSKYNPKTD